MLLTVILQRQLEINIQLISMPKLHHFLLGVVMVVHAAFATLLARTPRREGTLGQTKLSPIAQALHGKPKTPMPKPTRRRRGGRERQGRLRLRA